MHSASSLLTIVMSAGLSVVAGGLSSRMAQRGLNAVAAKKFLAGIAAELRLLNDRLFLYETVLTARQAAGQSYIADDLGGGGVAGAEDHELGGAERNGGLVTQAVAAVGAGIVQLKDAGLQGNVTGEPRVGRDRGRVEQRAVALQDEGALGDDGGTTVNTR